MRTILVLGCCVANVAFGLLAGAAHVHDSAGHHDLVREIHFDHAHLGGAADHAPAGSDHAARSGDGERHAGERHVEHHDGDARYYLTSSARCLPDSSLRAIPANLSAGVAIEPPPFVAVRVSESSDPPRGPPGTEAAPARAPPA
jgi:hypothetical protein